MSFNDHPFTEPLTDLTLDELDRKYSSLMNRWSTARRMQMPETVLHQLDLLLSSIELERERRILESINEKADGVILETDPIKKVVFQPKKR